MIRAYGFDGPFDKKKVTMADGALEKVVAKPRPLCSQLIKLTNGRGAPTSDPLRSASALLSAHWKMTACREKHTATYAIKQVGCEWPDPSWEARKRYAYFIQCLKEPE